MAAQIQLAVDSLQAVLAGADMTLATIVRLNAYTTDVDGCADLGVRRPVTRSPMG